MSWKRMFVLLLLWQSAAWCGNTFYKGEITLYNDSPYILSASVFTRSGAYLGQVTLQPGQQKNFVTNINSTSLNRPGYPDVSITPYRIIWQCPGGGIYSMCMDGAVGAFVRASACQGQLFCSPKEEKKPEQGLAPPPQKKSK